MLGCSATIYCLLVRFRFVRKGDGCDGGGRHSYLRCNSCVLLQCGKKLGCSADWNGEQLRGQNAATCFFLAPGFLTQRQKFGKFLSSRTHKFCRRTTPAGGPKAVNFAKSAPDLLSKGTAGSLKAGTLVSDFLVQNRNHPGRILSPFWMHVTSEKFWLETTARHYLTS